MQLTQKETTLLSDLKSAEKLCIEKYTRHAECARDPQLAELFRHIAQVERGHLDTLTQIENSGSAASGASNSQAQPPAVTATYGIADTEDKQADCYLCSDALAAEKHASQLYNTCVFEFTTGELRTALNHIQTEEQGHGKLIYDYMKANGMYS